MSHILLFYHTLLKKSTGIQVIDKVLRAERSHRRWRSGARSTDYQVHLRRVYTIELRIVLVLVLVLQMELDEDYPRMAGDIVKITLAMYIRFGYNISRQ